MSCFRENFMFIESLAICSFDQIFRSLITHTHILWIKWNNMFEYSNSLIKLNYAMYLKIYIQLLKWIRVPCFCSLLSFYFVPPLHHSSYIPISCVSSAHTWHQRQMNIYVCVLRSHIWIWDEMERGNTSKPIPMFRQLETLCNVCCSFSSLLYFSLYVSISPPLLCHFELTAHHLLYLTMQRNLNSYKIYLYNIKLLL